MCDFLFCRGAEISLITGAVHLFGKLITSSSFTSKSFSILDARQAVVSLAPVRKKTIAGPKSCYCFLSGCRESNSALMFPKHIYYRYTTPRLRYGFGGQARYVTISLQILSQEGKRKKPSQKIGTALINFNLLRKIFSIFHFCHTFFCNIRKTMNVVEFFKVHQNIFFCGQVRSLNKIMIMFKILVF